MEIIGCSGSKSLEEEYSIIYNKIKDMIKFIIIDKIQHEDRSKIYYGYTLIGGENLTELDISILINRKLEFGARCHLYNGYFICQIFTSL